MWSRFWLYEAISGLRASLPHVGGLHRPPRITLDSGTRRWLVPNGSPAGRDTSRAQSGADVALVRKAHEELSEGGVASFAQYAHQNVEWIPDRRVGEGPIRGRDEVSRFITDRASMFGEMEYDVEQTWDRGEQVLVFRIAHLWTLRDAMLVRGQGFGDRNEALQAAGLSE